MWNFLCLRRKREGRGEGEGEGKRKKNEERWKKPLVSFLCDSCKALAEGGADYRGRGRKERRERVVLTTGGCFLRRTSRTCRTALENRGPMAT